MDAGIIIDNCPGVRLCVHGEIWQRTVDADVDVSFRIHHLSLDRQQHTLFRQALRGIYSMDPVGHRNLEVSEKKEGVRL